MSINQGQVKDLIIPTVAAAKLAVSVGKVTFITELQSWFSGVENKGEAPDDLTRITSGLSGWDWVAVNPSVEEEEDMVNGEMIFTRSAKALTNCIPLDGRTLKLGQNKDKNNVLLEDVTTKSICLEEAIRNGTFTPVPTILNTTAWGRSVPSNSSAVKRLLASPYNGIGYTETATSQYQSAVELNISVYNNGNWPTYGVGTANGVIFPGGGGTHILVSGAGTAIAASNDGAFHRVDMPYNTILPCASTVTAMWGMHWAVAVGDIIYILAIAREPESAGSHFIIAYNMANKGWEDFFVELGAHTGINGSPDLRAQGIFASADGAGLLVLPMTNTGGARKLSYVTINNKTCTNLDIPSSIDANSGVADNVGLTIINGAVASNTAGQFFVCGSVIGSSKFYEGKVWTVSSSAITEQATLRYSAVNNNVHYLDISYNNASGIILYKHNANAGTYAVAKTSNTSTAPTDITTISVNGIISRGAVFIEHPAGPSNDGILANFSYTSTNSNTGNVVGLIKSGSLYTVNGLELNNLSANSLGSGNYLSANWFYDGTNLNAGYFSCSGAGSNAGNAHVYYATVGSISANGASSLSRMNIPSIGYAMAGSVSYLAVGTARSNRTFITVGGSAIVSPSSSGNNAGQWRVHSLPSTNNVAGTDIVQSANGTIVGCYLPSNSSLLFSFDSGKSYHTPIRINGPTDSAIGDLIIAPTIMTGISANKRFLVGGFDGVSVIAGTDGFIGYAKVTSTTSITATHTRLTGADASERVIGACMDGDSTTRAIYVALSNGSIYKTDFTGTSLPTTPAWTKQSYTVPVGGPSQSLNHNDSLYYAKIGTSQRLYFVGSGNGGLCYWKEIADTTWKRLKAKTPTPNGAVGVSVGVSFTPNSGSIVEMCGRAVWASGAILLIHDTQEDGIVFGSIFDDGQTNFAGASLCPDIGGKFALHIGTNGFWQISKPYEETTHFQLPTIPGSQVYWKTA